MSAAAFLGRAPAPTQPRRRPCVRRLLVAIMALAALLFAAPALAAFTPPPLTGHVVDTAGKLTPAEIADLDAKLDDVRRRSGFEIVAFIAGSLEGETIDDVAYEAFNAWKIGRKGLDNGVLLVIAPTERRVRIETGRGVGGALTDLQSNDIIRRTISPLLRDGRYYEAVDQGTAAIARTLVSGTPGTGPPPAEVTAPSLLRIGLYVVGGILVLILAIVSPTFRQLLFFLLFFGRGGGGGRGGGSGYSGGGGTSGGGGSSDSY